MKKFLKVVSIVLCMVTFLSFVGCNKGKKESDKIIGGDISYEGERTEIEIWVWEAGFGKEYMEKIAGAFVKKNPQYYITLESTADSSFIDNKLPLNAELNTADILMSIKPGTVTQYSEPIDDVLSYVNPGETMTIAEKMGATSDLIKYADGHYYYVPFASGWGGLTYNADIMADYFIPNTTNQLIELVDELVSDKKVPFMHFINGGYWDYIYQVWAGQYAGVDSLHDVYLNPTLEKVTSKDNGFYESLKVLEQCLNSSKKYYNGSNGQNHTDAQTLYLEGYAVMMANGTWMEYEMSGNYQPGEKNFRMMKTPIISSIIDKCTTIADDEELSCLIDAIDEGETALEGTGYSVNQADFDRIKDARSILYNNAIGHAACIPKYSENVQGAKDFLKFYYSNEAMKIFAETTKSHHVGNFDGNVTVDTSKWNAWQKEQYAYSESCIPFCESTNGIHALYTDGGLSMNAGIGIIAKLSTTNEADRLTASELWTNIVNYHNNNWDRYLSNAGLN